jgi:hypothetical protein
MSTGTFNLTKLLLSGVFIILISDPSIFSQDLEPRAYTNIPVGLNFVLTGYSYSAGVVIFDPTVPLENANIKIHGTVLAYARSINIFLCLDPAAPSPCLFQL